MVRAYIGFAALGAALLGGRPALAETSAWQCDRSPIVITNARIWPQARSAKQREMVVADGRIAAIGPAGSLRRPANSRIIDARGAWLLPGLIDSHMHFGRASLLAAGLLPDPVLPSWRVTGRQTLASGVTTVRVHYGDMERGPRWAREAEDPCSPSPSVLLGAGGLLGGPPGEGAWLAQVASPEEARQKLRDYAAVGAKWVELHDTQKFTADQLAAIADEAKRTGIGLISSGDSLAEAEAGVGAGVAAIDHFDGSLASAEADRLIALLANTRTYLIAPMGFFTRYNSYRPNPARVERDGWVARRFDTPAVGEALIKHTRLRFEQPPASEQQLADGYAVKSTLFRRLLRLNLRMVVGTDAGSQGHFHGDAIWWELRAWRDHGATLAQLIKAATVEPARLLRLPDRGALVQGARADFILYAGDLTSAELDVAKVSTVAKAGVLFVDKGRWIGPVEPGAVH